MRTYLARTTSSGHTFLARIPHGAAFLGTFLDDASRRDLTGAVADLLLSGVLDAMEQAESGRPGPKEQVEAVRVEYTEQLPAPGTVRPVASFTLLNVRTGEACDLAPEQVLPLLGRGLSVEITAAVAVEAADVPDDPAELGELGNI